MARDPLKQKIIRLLKEEFSSLRDKIILKDGFEDFLHLYIVSLKFKGKSEKEKDNLVWPRLFGGLTEEEWGRVSMLETLTPADARKYWPPMPELNGR